jgi:hypothetical protein
VLLILDSELLEPQLTELRNDVAIEVRLYGTRRGRLLFGEHFYFPPLKKLPKGCDSPGAIVEAIDSGKNDFHPTLGQGLRHFPPVAENDLPSNALRSLFR